MRVPLYVWQQWLTSITDSRAQKAGSVPLLDGAAGRLSWCHCRTKSTTVQQRHTGVTAAAPFARFALHGTAAASCAMLASLVLRRAGFWPRSWPAAGPRSRGSAAAAAAAAAAKNGPGDAEPSEGSDASGATDAAPQSAVPADVQPALGATTRQRRRAGANGGSGASQPMADDEKVDICQGGQPVMRLK